MGLLGTWLILSAGSLDVGAAPPTLDALHPSGGSRGGETAFVVTAVGKQDPWPVEAWCSNPGVHFEAGEKAGEFQVKIDADAELGPCWVRLHQAEGASEPRLFVVTSAREIVEATDTSNDSPREPAEVGTLPVIINGRLEKSQDVDAWQVDLEKGQRLDLRLDGYALRSGIDPFLHLYDPSGTRIRLASDHSRNLDPRLTYEAERSGPHVIGVVAIASPPNANVHFHGAAGAAYRLGIGLDGSLGSEVSGLSDGKGLEELKPLPLTPEANPATLPVRGWGSLEEPGGSDRIRFTATKGQSVEIRVEAVDYGFETDPVLVLEKADGSVIRETDDTKPDRDAIYLYRIPVDGEYVARIKDRFGRGGDAMRYSLSIEEAMPRWSGTVDRHHYLAKPGEKTTIKWTLVRSNGHAAPLELAIEGLPDGIQAEGLAIEEKAVSGEVKLVVAESARPFSGPIRLKVQGSKEEGEPFLPFSFQDSNARGPYLLDEIEDLWLTVPEPAKADKDS